MADHKDAELILKLYELRREGKMREARQWMFQWSPKSADDVLATINNPEHSWKYRQFTSYWEMACALVNNGILDADLFDQTNGEFYPTYVKLQPFLEELRGRLGPKVLMQVERFIKSRPDHEEQIARWKKRLAGR